MKRSYQIALTGFMIICGLILTAYIAGLYRNPVNGEDEEIHVLYVGESFSTFGDYNYNLIYGGSTYYSPENDGFLIYENRGYGLAFTVRVEKYTIFQFNNKWFKVMNVDDDFIKFRRYYFD